MMKPIFIVGDIHGCFEQFMNLLKKAQYDSHKHKLILLGDLINKGPYSFKVLEWVKNTQKVQVIIGNHELNFIHALDQSISLSPILKKLKKDMGPDIKKYISWIKSWPTYIEEESFLAVHGGLVPNEHPSISQTKYLVNIRYWAGEGKTMNDSTTPAWHDLYKGSKLVIYAHWAKQGLKIKKNSIGLDTACVYGGKLTGIWLPTKQIVQVDGYKNI